MPLFYFFGYNKTNRKSPLQRNLVNQQVTFIVKLKILFDFIFCPIKQLYPVLLLDEEHIYGNNQEPSSIEGLYPVSVQNMVYTHLDVCLSACIPLSDY